jgi:Asp-tRNA(Asn)/Glu-tRNA(Gln) amidotransferase A subunit family amidase
MNYDASAIDSTSTKTDGKLAELGVAAAATAIREGAISSESYAAALLEQARRHRDLHAFITIDEPAVMTAAAEADKARAAGSTAPLLGVPFGVKDSYLTQGLRTTIGVRTLESFVPDRDATAVRAIKDAGGIVFGKNNLVEMSYGLTGANARFGQVKNPRGSEHVAGGSSSGSAASVAARIVPAAFGGDTIGSIRVPAALTGVVGFKPTTGRWPRDGVAPVSHTLDTTGLLARSVDDCLLIDQIIVGVDAAPSAARPGLEGVRFAYAPKQFLGLVDPEIEARFDQTLQLLRSSGATVVEIDLGEDFPALADRVAWNLFFRETRHAVSEFVRTNDIPTTFGQIYDELKPQLKDVWGQFVVASGAGHLSDADLERTLTVDRPNLQRRLGSALGEGDFDALVFPTVAALAPLIEEQWSLTVAGEQVDHLFLAKNTIPASGAGLPGISIPLGRARSGLPFGIELDGARGDDRRLLQVARLVERVLGASPA